MPIGQNLSIGDKLIKKTTRQEKGGGMEGETAVAERPQVQNPVSPRRSATTNTIKMTFYVKQELLEKLYNYAYWDRLTVTEAFNTVVAEGLKGKNTAPIKKQ